MECTIKLLITSTQGVARHARALDDARYLYCTTFTRAHALEDHTLIISVVAT